MSYNKKNLCMQLSNKTYDLQKKLPKCQMTPQYL